MTMRYPTAPSHAQSRWLLSDALGSVPADRMDSSYMVAEWTELARLRRLVNRGPGAYAYRIKAEFERLGPILNEWVRDETPVSSGRLKRSTHFRILSNSRITGLAAEPGVAVFTPDRGTLDTPYFLQILQDATARGVRSASKRYFYWYTVNKGSKPAGELGQHQPPAEHLKDWVKRSPMGTGEDSDSIERIAESLSRKIFREGVEPNPYVARAHEKAQVEIRQVAARLGTDIATDLTKMPSIVDADLLRLPATQSIEGNIYAPSMLDALDDAYSDPNQLIPTQNQGFREPFTPGIYENSIF